MNDPSGSFDDEARKVAQVYMTLWMPSQILCPSEAAESAVIRSLSAGAERAGIAVEVVDLRPEPAARLADVTERMSDWNSSNVDSGSKPSLLILRDFDVFGDKEHEAPTYPFRARLQFDELFRWVFLGRNPHRMHFLFGSYERPLYRASDDITPSAWRVGK